MTDQSKKITILVHNITPYVQHIALALDQGQASVFEFKMTYLNLDNFKNYNFILHKTAFITRMTIIFFFLFAKGNLDEYLEIRIKNLKSEK